MEAGIPPEAVFLLGFSQGACLVLEYAARHARRYGGVIGLSGGIIGPDETPRDYGRLAWKGRRCSSVAATLILISPRRASSSPSRSSRASGEA